MSFNDTAKKEPHVITLIDRSNLTVSGVIDVINFDEHLVEATTTCGEMVIDGDELKISALDIDKGEITLSGKIFGIYYSEKKNKKSQATRL